MDSRSGRGDRPDHGEGGGEVVDIIELRARRGGVLLLDHRHVRRRRM